MAVINYSLTPTQTSLATICRWPNLTTGDTGTPMPHSQYTDKSVQVVGTFGGATVVIQGSNDDGVNWTTLTDPQGNALSFSAAGLEMVSEATGLIRPSVSGGAGVSVSIHMLCKE